MNFFEQQDKARSTTTRLVVLFVLAVCSLILLTSVLVALTLAVSDQRLHHNANAVALPLAQLLPVLPGIAAVVISVVLLGVLYKTLQLRGGGKSIAELAGGRLLQGTDCSVVERKILNVVEEMALASGVPVPPVYLIEDDAINAFAAGYQQHDAVIGITRGAITLLDRDELQGVIAHEFSHIFNGDMRLNLRLIGWLYGLLVIALVGRMLLRVPGNLGRKRNQGEMAIFGLGLGLVALGYAGVLFGNIIKSAVSRQREYLADASAVQFTRNPAGIGSALKKIGGYALGSQLKSTETTEISHLLFCEGTSLRSGFLFATHPPLEDRIRRIDPGWDGQMIVPQPDRPTDVDSNPATRGRSGPAAATIGASAIPLATAMVNAVASPSMYSLDLANIHKAQVPEELRSQLASSLDASLLMYALMVTNSAGATAIKQELLLQQQLNAESFRMFKRQTLLLASLTRNLDLTMVDLAHPALRQLSATQLQEFLQRLQALADVDGILDVEEWALLRLLQHYLTDTHALSRPDRLAELAACGEECRILLSVLARAGQENAASAAAAFAASWQRLAMAGTAAYQQDAALPMLDSAINKLRGVKPLQKPRLLKAMVDCVEHDGKLTRDEFTLLRAVSSLLDCPMPPLH